MLSSEAASPTASRWSSELVLALIASYGQISAEPCMASGGGYAGLSAETGWRLWNQLSAGRGCFFRRSLPSSSPAVATCLAPCPVQALACWAIVPSWQLGVGRRRARLALSWWCFGTSKTDSTSTLIRALPLPLGSLTGAGFDLGERLRLCPFRTEPFISARSLVV